MDSNRREDLKEKLFDTGSLPPLRSSGSLPFAVLPDDVASLIRRRGERLSYGRAKVLVPQCIAGRTSNSSPTDVYGLPML